MTDILVGLWRLLVIHMAAAWWLFDSSWVSELRKLDGYIPTRKNVQEMALSICSNLGKKMQKQLSVGWEVNQIKPLFNPYVYWLGRGSLT